LATREAKREGKRDRYSATSSSGDFAEALRGAIAAAERGINANFFTWRFEGASGSVGGFAGAHDVTVTISAGQPSAAELFPGETGERYSDWEVWHNGMPGSTPTLLVVGRCVFPTAGYRVELTPVVPQGINPAIYLLEKVVHAPTGSVTQVETEVPVVYGEPTSAFYSEVHILPDNVVIPVRVTT
jgi:hypothetical protein